MSVWGDLKGAVEAPVKAVVDTGKGAVKGVEVVRAQTDALSGVGQINDSGVRILHSARALRKVAVGR